MLQIIFSYQTIAYLLQELFKVWSLMTFFTFSRVHLFPNKKTPPIQHNVESEGKRWSVNSDLGGGPFVLGDERGQIATIGGFGLESVTFVALLAPGDFGFDF